MLKDLFPQHKQRIQEIALERYPEECVIVITKDKGLYELNNISKDPENSFSISRKDTEKVFDEVLLAVIHSHPDAEPVPSSADMTYQRQCNIPFGIVATDGSRVSEVVYFGDQVEYDLEKRPFIHSVCDCYSLIRDFYKEKLNINLPEFERDWEWWNSGEDMYLDNLKSTGFYQVDEPQYGDMVIACVRSKVPNHAGVYVDNEMIFHHISGGLAIDTTRLPRKEPIQRLFKFIHSYWRYGDIKNENI